MNCVSGSAVSSISKVSAASFVAMLRLLHKNCPLVMSLFTTLNRVAVSTTKYLHPEIDQAAEIIDNRNCKVVPVLHFVARRFGNLSAGDDSRLAAPQAYLLAFNIRGINHIKFPQKNVPTLIPTGLFLCLGTHIPISFGPGEVHSFADKFEDFFRCAITVGKPLSAAIKSMG